MLRTPEQQAARRAAIRNTAKFKTLAAKRGVR
jgi:hypothetical protein